VGQKRGKAMEMALGQWCREAGKRKWKELEMGLKQEGEVWRRFRGAAVNEMVASVKEEAKWLIEELKERVGVGANWADVWLRRKDGEWKEKVCGECGECGCECERRNAVSVDLMVWDKERRCWGWVEVKKGDAEVTREDARRDMEKLWKVAQEDVGEEWVNETLVMGTKGKASGVVVKPGWVASAVVEGEGATLAWRWRRWDVAKEKCEKRESRWCRRSEGRKRKWTEAERKEANKKRHTDYNGGEGGQWREQKRAKKRRKIK